MSDVKPLAKPKFWARSIRAYAPLLEDLGQPVPGICRRSVHSLSTMKPLEHARAMFDLGYALRKLSYNGRTDWGKWWQLKAQLAHPGWPIGAIVYIEGSIIGNRQLAGIGQLTRILHAPKGNRVYDYTDKGPRRLYADYELLLFDGSWQRWTDASYVLVPTVREIELYGHIKVA